MGARKWTRRCANFQQAITNTALRCGVTEDKVEYIILKYFYRIKQLILQGERVQLPGIIYIGTYYTQLKKLRRFMGYKQLKQKYGNKEYFRKHIKKS